MAVEMKEIDFNSYPLFEGLPQQMVDDFVALGELRRLEANVQLVSMADVGQTFFLIMNGMAKVTLERGVENQISLMILREGDFFGEVAILENHQSRTANVISMTPMDVFCLDRDSFYKVMNQHPSLALSLAKGLTHRIRVMNERTVALTLPPYLKVARSLMVVAGKPSLKETNPIPLPALTIEEWTQFCHSNDAELRGCLAMMEKAGAICWGTDDQITITNVVQLKEFAVGNLP